MPYKIAKKGSGYNVVNKETDKKYAKKPQTKAMAKRQMAAIYANTDESFENKVAAILEKDNRALGIGGMSPGTPDFSDLQVVGMTGDVEHETWDDPGDYPSGAGGGPLPSQSYATFDGEITIGGSPQSIQAIQQFAETNGKLPPQVEALALDAFHNIAPNARVHGWEWNFNGPTAGKEINVWPSDFDVDRDEPDYGDFSDFDDYDY